MERKLEKSIRQWLGIFNGIVVGLGCSVVPFKIIFGLILFVNLIVFTKKVAPKYNEIFKEN